MTQSHRIEQVQTPVIPVVGELIRRHPGTISLGQGIVWYDPPAAAIAGLQEFLATPDQHKYQAVQGIPPLLDAIGEKLRAENGIEVDRGSRVVVTAGGNMAFVNALLAIADPGDEILLPAPFYFNHEMAIVMAGCRPVLVPTDASWQLRPDAVAEAITARTRAIVTVSPNNPTGAVYPAAALAEINALCRDRGLYHISDEAYEYFVYGDARHVSPGAFAGANAHTISLFSLSKAYGFASWRIGYQVIPEHLFEAVRKIQDTILICPPVVSQFAALGALRAGAGYCREKLAGFAEVREMVMAELDALRDCCEIPPADGAFYFLLRVDSSMKPLDLVERLVREHGVAAIPGDAFGAPGCSLRISYGALQKATVAEGVGRLVDGIRKIIRG